MEDLAEVKISLFKDTVIAYLDELEEMIICENSLGKTKELYLPNSSTGWELLGTDEQFAYLKEK